MWFENNQSQRYGMIVEKTLHTQTIFTQGVAIGLGYIWLTANAEG
jgi:hypothetical protein